MIEQLSLLLTPTLVKMIQTCCILLTASTIEDLIDGFIWPGNILNFNVGASVDLDIPRSFWSRLAGKYGNMFYWKEKVNYKVVGIFSSLVFGLCKEFILK
jgi:hypothetical protein